MQVPERNSAENQLYISRPDGNALIIHLAGDWRTGHDLPGTGTVEKEVTSGAGLRTVSFDTSGLTNWDSTLLVFMLKVKQWCQERKIEIKSEGLPEGAQRLLKLASAVPERQGARKEAKREPFFSMVGQQTLQCVASTSEMLAFLGGAFIAFARLLTGRASFRRSDLTLFLQESGVQALGDCFPHQPARGADPRLRGCDTAQDLGAQIYVADLVGIAMVRVMGAIMAGIIMAGRTGASYAAQLGTMQVNEEIDALQTLGISPMEFLVLPRMLALIVMMPLLCVYADVMGILGGLIVGVTMLDLNPTIYLNETMASFQLTNLWIGLFYSAVFGVIVALAGCLGASSAAGALQPSAKRRLPRWLPASSALSWQRRIITVICSVLGL